MCVCDEGEIMAKTYEVLVTSVPFMPCMQRQKHKGYYTVMCLDSGPIHAGLDKVLKWQANACKLADPLATTGSWE